MHKLQKYIKINGFTLAEVLITLVIIGILAALTIPSLLQNIQDTQFKTAWRKVFSDLNQATLRIKTDNGGDLLGVCTWDEGVRDKYLAYLSYTKKCDWAADYGNCFYNINQLHYLDGSSVNPTTYDYPNGAGAVLVNSVLIHFYPADPNCAGRCGWMLIDVNGNKGPNKVGKDVFGVDIRKDGIVAWGRQGTAYENDCPGYGLGCAAYYLYQ